MTFDTKFYIHDEPAYWQRELDPPPIKVAWLFHMIDADNLISLEPESARITTRRASSSSGISRRAPTRWS